VILPNTYNNNAQSMLIVMYNVGTDWCEWSLVAVMEVPVVELGLVTGATLTQLSTASYSLTSEVPESLDHQPS